MTQKPQNESADLAWQSCIETELGQTITPEEHDTLAAVPFPEDIGASRAFYEGKLYVLRGKITAAEFERGLAKAIELEARYTRAQVDAASATLAETLLRIKTSRN